MRPAQLTPENCLYNAMPGQARQCFNEAGAINAGKRKNARRKLGKLAGASMRPAQLTPENTYRKGQAFLLWLSFNEAGAINAGKQTLEAIAVIVGVLLQ